MPRLSLVNLKALGIAISIPALFLLIGIAAGNSFGWYDLKREAAASQLSELLSNYIGLLGLGFAILAILFAIIQLAYRQLSIIEVLIESSLFLPVFYYGMINILICAILSTFQYPGEPLSNFYYCRLVVIQGYLFWLLIPAIAFVFIRTVTLTNFSLISELYLNRLRRMTTKEKKGNTSDKFRENLQSYGLEVQAEVGTLMGQNKVILLNKFFDFYVDTLAINHNSNLLDGIHRNFKTWFIQSYKLPDIEIFHNVIGAWWKLYRKALSLDNTDKLKFLASIPLELYNQYKRTKDNDLKEIAIGIFPIRLKEFALIRYFQLRNERKDFELHYEKIKANFLIFPELLKAAIDENDIRSLESIFTQIRLFHDTLLSDKEELEYKRRFVAGNYSASDEQLNQTVDKLIVLLATIRLNAYAWITYKFYDDGK